MPDQTSRTVVLRVITRLNIGGPSIQAIRLTSDLRKTGFDTVLVHGRLGEGEGDMRYLLPDEPLDVRYLQALRRPIAPLADLRALIALVRLMREVQPDIVHTHMAKAGLIGRLAARLYNLTARRGRRVLTVHTYHGHVLEGYFSPALAAALVMVERWLGRHTTKLIAISPRIREELVERYAIAPAERFHVVPLGFDLAPLAAVDDGARASARAALDIPDSAHVVTTVGRLTAIKNQELFLDAAARIAAADPHVIFLIVGDGELRNALEARTAALGITSQVRFLGWRRDLAIIYGATDVFVLTSRNEGTPVALIEAMAAGIPGVATSVGGVPDVVADGTTGVLVPINSVDAIADAVLRLLGDEGARHAMGTRARASVVDRYDLRRLVRNVEHLYRSLLDAERPS